MQRNKTKIDFYSKAIILKPVKKAALIAKAEADEKRAEELKNETKLRPNGATANSPVATPWVARE
jgi:hypothetical protein